MNLQQAYSKLDAFKTHRLPPGGFLNSILNNDLTSTVLKSDEESKKLIAEITQYCWDNLPHNIWGSPEKVEAHLYENPHKKPSQMPSTGLRDIQL